jgi:hypothetical protein
MKILKIQIERNSNINRTKQMSYGNEKEFFTALVTLCDELGTDVPFWTTYEERILEKEGQFSLEMENGDILKIYSYSADGSSSD